jgi:hypothetical protein
MVAPVLRVLRVLLGVVGVVVSGASLLCLHVKRGSVSYFKYQGILHFPCYKRDTSVRVNEPLKVWLFLGKCHNSVPTYSKQSLSSTK